MATPLNGSMNLFLQGQIPNPVDSEVDLSLTGSSAGTSYEFKKLNLFLNAIAFYGTLNLWLSGTSTPTQINAGLNLTLQAGNYPASGWVDMILFGAPISTLNYATITLDQFVNLNVSEYGDLTLSDYGVYGYPVYNGITLYIEGEGEIPGAFATSTYLNLIIKTVPGVDRGLLLYLNAEGPNNAELPLSLAGVLGYLTGSVNLAMPSRGYMNKVLKLFTRGYTP